MLPPKARLTLRGNYKSTKRTGSTATAHPSAAQILLIFQPPRQGDGWPGAPLARPDSILLISIELFSFAATLFHAFSMEQFENFLADESGQDLIEYTLLISFVAMASAALFIGGGRNVKGIWSSSNSQLTAANTSAS